MPIPVLLPLHRLRISTHNLGRLEHVIQRNVLAPRHEELLPVSGGGGKSLLVLAGMWDHDRRCSQSCTTTPTPSHSQTCHVCRKRASGTQTKASYVPQPLQPLGTANSSTRMCLSLDGPALPLILPCDLLLMRRFLRLPERRWKSVTPAASKMGLAARIGVIAASATLPMFAVVDRDSNADTAAASGVGGPGTSPLIFSASQCTYICNA